MAKTYEEITHSHHDIDRIGAHMNHHFVVAGKGGGGSQHIGDEARGIRRTGIKKNCLVARQFQTFYRVGLLENHNLRQQVGSGCRREVPFGYEGVLQHYSQFPALLFAFSMEPTIRPA